MEELEKAAQIYSQNEEEQIAFKAGACWMIEPKKVKLTKQLKNNLYALAIVTIAIIVLIIIY